MLFVVWNRSTAGYQVIEGNPKTAAGVRAVALDRHTVKVLREHRRRQADQRDRRLAAGKNWHDSGYVFVRKDGTPIHPGYASTRFRLLIKRALLLPVRLHDLRHGAASLAHEAGADLRPANRRATGTPAPAGPRTGRKPQVNARDTGRALPTVMTPGWHPRDTHRPQQTYHNGRRNRVRAGQVPDDVARPKGLEPLTF